MIYASNLTLSSLIIVKFKLKSKQINNDKYNSVIKNHGIFKAYNKF